MRDDDYEECENEEVDDDGVSTSSHAEAMGCQIALAIAILLYVIVQGCGKSS